MNRSILSVIFAVISSTANSHGLEASEYERVCNLIAADKSMFFDQYKLTNYYDDFEKQFSYFIYSKNEYHIYENKTERGLTPVQILSIDESGKADLLCSFQENVEYKPVDIDQNKYAEFCNTFTEASKINFDIKTDVPDQQFPGKNDTYSENAAYIDYDNDGIKELILKLLYSPMHGRFFKTYFIEMSNDKTTTSNKFLENETVSVSRDFYTHHGLTVLVSSSGPYPYEKIVTKFDSSSENYETELCRYNGVFSLITIIEKKPKATWYHHEFFEAYNKRVNLAH